MSNILNGKSKKKNLVILILFILVVGLVIVALNIDKIINIFKENDDKSLPKTMLLGDANNDGVVDDNDVLELNKYLYGNGKLSEQGYTNMDYNNDGKIDKLDEDKLEESLFEIIEKDEVKVTLFGDVNVDGEVNDKDLTSFNNYLSNDMELSLQGMANADYNSDGTVDNSDLDELLKYLANKDSNDEKVQATLLGDVYIDGEVNGKDVLMLRRHLSNNEELSAQAMANADYNSDGIVDEKDLTELRNYMANKDYDN